MNQSAGDSYKRFLRILLERSGLSKAELAKRIHVTPSYVSQIFGAYPNTSPPSTKRLVEIAEVLGASQAETQELIKDAVLERASEEERKLIMRLQEIIDESHRDSSFQLPLYADAPCDRFVWVDAEEQYAENIYLAPNEYVPGGFILRARGDSMAKVIMDGDLLIFDPSRKPKSGEIVCAQLTGEDEGTTIKYYYNRGSVVELRPENPAYDPLILVKQPKEHFLFNNKKVGLLIKGVLKALKRSF